MNKHQKANVVYRIIGAFLEIKKLSNSGEIDRLCLDGLATIGKITEAEKIQKELDEIRARMIDPTN